MQVTVQVVVVDVVVVVVTLGVVLDVVLVDVEVDAVVVVVVVVVGVVGVVDDDVKDVVCTPIEDIVEVKSTQSPFMQTPESRGVRLHIIPSPITKPS